MTANVVTAVLLSEAFPTAPAAIFLLPETSRRSFHNED